MSVIFLKIQMKISIFGLGYVGVVTSAILARNNQVVGVDVNPVKVDLINKGNSPIIETDVDKLIKDGVENNNLKATTDSKEAILDSDLSVVCVGTPSNQDGSHNLNYLDKVLSEISDLIKEKDSYHLVVIRSTSPPGTTEEMIEKYFKNLNVGICFNPEFLREGSAVKDYINPPYIVIACNDDKSIELMKEFYKEVDSELLITSFKEAEILKIVSNVFHALKIVFGNEIGRFCESYGIDGRNVMDLICKDKKLNISEKYLKPGFAYGGSCLPKDLKSFLYLTKQKDVCLPLIGNISLSNEAQINAAINKIQSHNKKSVSFLGLSFKPGTDDLRESPYVRLVEHFIGKGYSVKIYDPNVSLAKLMGANKEYLEREIPHISQLLYEDMDDVMDSEILVINHNFDIKSNIQDKKYLVDLS
ncbi:nucleotide sugar dehydrogenase [Candidatus Woesearchaeota archaeon]|nr:nucleotide sugar dehydrogenase [Candidatus Woesearchaeota archaeon]